MKHEPARNVLVAAVVTEAVVVRGAIRRKKDLFSYRIDLDKRVCSDNPLRPHY
jgi:hypothetical protein